MVRTRLTALSRLKTNRRSALPLLFSLCFVHDLAAQQGRVIQANYRVARGKGDTLNAGVINATGVVYQAEPTASANYGPAGQMRLAWRADAFGIATSNQFRLGSAAQLQSSVDANLAGRAVAARTITDAALRSLATFAAETRPFVAAALPFELYDVAGHKADAVMLTRHVPGNAADSAARNSRLIGNGIDTVRVSVPPNVWLPGDTLYVIGNGSGGRYVSMKLTLGCAPNGVVPARITCNPLALGTRGATGYRPFDAGYESVWRVQ